MKVEKLSPFIGSFPEDARSKCTLSTKTLTHIDKKAEVQTGTETVTRVLAEKVNGGVVPADVVIGTSFSGYLIEEATASAEFENAYQEMTNARVITL